MPILKTCIDFRKHDASNPMVKLRSFGFYEILGSSLLKARDNPTFLHHAEELLRDTVSAEIEEINNEAREDERQRKKAVLAQFLQSTIYYLCHPRKTLEFSPIDNKRVVTELLGVLFEPPCGEYVLFEDQIYADPHGRHTFLQSLADISSDYFEPFLDQMVHQFEAVIRKEEKFKDQPEEMIQEELARRVMEILLHQNEGLKKSALLMAIDSGNEKAVDTMIKVGKRFKGLEKLLSQRDVDENNSLLLAVKKQRKGIVFLILEVAKEAGYLSEIINAQDENANTAATVCAIEQRKIADTMRSVRKISEGGRSAFYHYEAMALLLEEYEADLTIPNRDGMTMLDYKEYVAKILYPESASGDPEADERPFLEVKSVIEGGAKAEHIKALMEGKGGEYLNKLRTYAKEGDTAIDICAKAIFDKCQSISDPVIAEAQLEEIERLVHIYLLLRNKGVHSTKCGELLGYPLAIEYVLRARNQHTDHPELLKILRHINVPHAGSWGLKTIEEPCSPTDLAFGKVVLAILEKKDEEVEHLLLEAKMKGYVRKLLMMSTHHGGNNLLTIAVKFGTKKAVKHLANMAKETRCIKGLLTKTPIEVLSRVNVKELMKEDEDPIGETGPSSPLERHTALMQAIVSSTHSPKKAAARVDFILQAAKEEKCLEKILIHRNQQDYKDYSALLLAVVVGNIKLIKRLVEVGREAGCLAAMFDQRIVNSKEIFNIFRICSEMLKTPAVSLMSKDLEKILELEDVQREEIFKLEEKISKFEEIVIFLEKTCETELGKAQIEGNVSFVNKWTLIKSLSIEASKDLERIYAGLEPLRNKANDFIKIQQVRTLSRQNEEEVEMLMRQVSPYYLLRASGFKGHTALMTAVKNRKFISDPVGTGVKDLLKKGEEAGCLEDMLTACDKTQTNAFFHAVYWKGNLPVLDHLVEAARKVGCLGVMMGQRRGEGTSVFMSCKKEGIDGQVQISKEVLKFLLDLTEKELQEAQEAGDEEGIKQWEEIENLSYECGLRGYLSPVFISEEEKVKFFLLTVSSARGAREEFNAFIDEIKVRGGREAVKELFEMISEQGFSALISAAQFGKEDRVERLLNEAMALGDKRCVYKILMYQKREGKLPALHNAIRGGHVGIVKKILEAAAWAGHLSDVINLVCKGGVEENPINTCATGIKINILKNNQELGERCLEIYKLLREQGANPWVTNNKGDTAMDIIGKISRMGNPFAVSISRELKQCEDAFQAKKSAASAPRLPLPPRPFVPSFVPPPPFYWERAREWAPSQAAPLGPPPLPFIQQARNPGFRPEATPMERWSGAARGGAGASPPPFRARGSK